MSAILYIGGVLYLLAVIQTTGKRWNADFHAWETRMHDLTVSSVLTQTGKGEYHVRANAGQSSQVRA